MRIRPSAIHSPTHRIAAGLFLALVSLGACSVARATNYIQLCARTAQEFQDNLTAASNGGTYAGYDVHIQLAAGTYQVGAATGNGPFHYSSTAAAGFIFIDGGWDSLCETETKDPSLTVLDGNHLAQVLNIENQNDESDLYWMTIQNGNTADIGGGVSINFDNLGGGKAVIENTVIVNNHTTGQGGGLAVLVAGHNAYFAIEENLIAHNSADAGYGAGLAESTSTGSLTRYLLHNTVYGNTTIASGGAGGFGCCGSSASAAFVTSNIFWQNTTYGIFLVGSGPQVYLGFNVYGTAGGDAPYNSYDNLLSNPDFVNDSDNNFHLSDGSPALGYSAPLYGFCGGIDLDNHQQNDSSRCEPGAFEETIFTGSFE